MELANALVTGERHRRINRARANEFIALIGALPIVIDEQTPSLALSTVLEAIERGTLPHRNADKGPGYEVDRGERGMRRLDRQRRGDRLRRKCQHITDRDILLEDLREARRRAVDGRVRGVEHAKIFRRPAGWVEHRLARGQKPIAIGLAVIVGRTIPILAGKMQCIRNVVGGPHARIIRAVRADCSRAKRSQTASTMTAAP